MLKPTKTTKQKSNRDLAEFYGRKWSKVLKTKGLSESSLFYWKGKTEMMNCEKIPKIYRLSH